MLFYSISCYYIVSYLYHIISYDIILYYITLYYINCLQMCVYIHIYIYICTYSFKWHSMCLLSYKATKHKERLNIEHDRAQLFPCVSRGNFPTSPLKSHAKLRITGRQLKQPKIRKTMLLKNIAFLVGECTGVKNLGSMLTKIPWFVEILSLPPSNRP